MPICPLLMISVKEPKIMITDPEKTWAECLRENCAWFVRIEQPGMSSKNADEGCALRQLAYKTNFIAARMTIK